MERTYIMIKPDGVQRTLVGEIIARFEKKGYKLAALKVWTVGMHVSAVLIPPFARAVVDPRVEWQIFINVINYF